MNAAQLLEAVKLSGLHYTQLQGWRHRGRPGTYAPRGTLIHHTGSYDGVGDTADDLAYAGWLGRTGRSDLPAPLAQLSLSAEGHVYLLAAGRANHAGVAKSSGPIPAGDGNTFYVGIEAMNSGTQGWSSKGWDRSGQRLTQYEAYVRLCAAICVVMGWRPETVRAHKETSTTGKWDPGLIDPQRFRLDVAAATKTLQKRQAPRFRPETYKLGRRHPANVWLKKRLWALGYRGFLPKNDVYGRGIRAAVRRFQLQQGWTGSGADGYPGPETLRRIRVQGNAALRKQAAARKAKG